MKKKKTEKGQTITGKGRPMEIEESRIHFAPWNPRAEITRDDVAELAESIRCNGLLNRVSVIVDPQFGSDDEDAHYIAFAGNRRLAACREAGLRKIPCEVFDIDVQAAKVLTALENLQRKDVEPIREAGLVEECLDAGMSGEEIAAKIGKSNAWVTRRRKLLSLPPKVRQAAERFPEKITADALEQIAVRPVAAKKLDGKVAKLIENQNGRIDWSGIRYWFDSEERELVDAMWFKFPCKTFAFGEKCARCAKRTGAQPDLFGEVHDDRELGRCLDKTCFCDTESDWKKLLFSERIPEGTEIVELYSRFGMPDDVQDEPDEAHPCAYVICNKYEKEFVLKWGESERERRERTAREQEAARNKSKEEYAAELEVSKLLGEVRDRYSYPREVGEAIRPLFAADVPELAFRRICEWLAEAIGDTCGDPLIFVALSEIEPLRRCLTEEQWSLCKKHGYTVDEVEWEARYEEDGDDSAE